MRLLPLAHHNPGSRTSKAAFPGSKAVATLNRRRDGQALESRSTSIRAKIGTKDIFMWFQSTAIIGTFAWSALAVWGADLPYLHAPSVDTYAKHDPNGITILSSGRYLKPVGRHLPVANSPYGLAISRDGNLLFVASDGVGQFITDWRESSPVVSAFKPPAYSRGNRRREKPSNAGGADFSP